MAPRILYCLLISSSLAVPDFFLPGPFEVDHVHINREIFGSLDHQLDVYFPHSGGVFPVFLFLPGVACMAPGSAYSDVLSHIASWGYAVVAPNALIYSMEATYRAEWIDPILKWMEEHLSGGSQEDIHQDLVLDFESLYISAHSSGAHVAVNYLKLGDCSSVKAVALFSPVDGEDPFGLIPEFCITPGEMLPFMVPTFIQAGGLDTLPGIDNLGGIMPACAPIELGSERFYNAMPGPTILMNATEYGHVDILNQIDVDIIQAIMFCKVDKDKDKDAFRQEVGGQIVSFFKFVAESECSLLDLLLGYEDSQTGVLKEIRWKGDMENSCGSPSCH